MKTAIDNGNKYALFYVVTDIAKHMQSSIINRKLKLKPIRYSEKIDGMSRKTRIIGVQEPLHQMFDYVAVNGMKPMLMAKIGVFQCASLPGKGQSYGKKYIEKWVNEKETVYFFKGDVKQCFPSMPHKRLKELLKRDIKNDTLLWLVFELIDMFGKAHILKIKDGFRVIKASDKGISIGSYLSQYLSNYYLSYAYHYATEQLFKIRKTKHKGNIRVRLINHVLFYMDDFLLTGSSKKDLTKATKMLIKFVYDFLELTIKPDWKICKISDTEPIDMMGFVFRKGRTTIRTKIFLKTRRYYLEVDKLIKQGKSIPLLLASRCVSGYGWYKNTDSYKVRQKLNIDKIHNTCKKVISHHAKLKNQGGDNIGIVI